MRFVAIEFRNVEGNRFTLGDAVMHTAIYTVCFAFFLLQIVSIVLMLMGSKGQSLGDHAIGSVAINRPAKRYR